MATTLTVIPDHTLDRLLPFHADLGPDLDRLTGRLGERNDAGRRNPQTTKARVINDNLACGTKMLKGEIVIDAKAPTKIWILDIRNAAISTTKTITIDGSTRSARGRSLGAGAAPLSAVTRIQILRSDASMRHTRRIRVGTYIRVEVVR